MYDIAIIGAGPAGATLGRLLDKRYKVLILEKRRLDMEGGGKCCGGLLAPMAQKELAVQGMGLPREVLCSPQIFAVKTMDLETGRTGYYQRHYINLDRGRFERYLYGLIQGNFDVRCGTLVHCMEKRENMKVIHFTSEGRQYTEEARMVVAADGGASVMSRHAAASTVHNSPQYIAMQEWHRADSIENCFYAFFDGNVTDYYAWAIPKDGAILVGVALPWRKDAPKRFAALKEKLVQAGILPAGKPWRMESAPVMRPEHPSQILSHAGDTAFAGEAGGWISSSSSEGIGPALYSGRVLSECINSHFGEKDCLRQYEHMMRGERGKLASKIMKGKIICTPWMRNLLMASHISQIQVSNTALVQEAFI